MQIHEFYQQEKWSNDDFECFEGRWHWKIEFLKPDPNSYQIEWTDLFEKYKKLTFNFESSGYVCDAIPISCRFILLKCRESIEFPEGWWILELDWANEKCILSINSLSTEIDYTVLIDCVGPQLNGDLEFLLYKKENEQLKCLHCNIDSHQRQIQQISNTFYLSKEQFDFMDLNGTTVYGLSTSLDKISCFDLKNQQIIKSSQVQNLPVLKTKRNFHGEIIGAWTSSNFYVCFEEGYQCQECSTIYSINIETGISKALNYRFDGIIHWIFAGSDGHLYVCVYKFVRHNKRTPHTVYQYRFFRIAINQPESLTFLASAAIPRPWPKIVEKIVAKQDKIPMRICKI